MHKSVTVKICFPEILPQRLRNILHGLDHLQRTIQFSNEEIIGRCNAVVQDGKGPQFVVDAAPGIHGCRVMDGRVIEFLLLDIDGGIWEVDEFGIFLKAAVLTGIQIFLHEIGCRLVFRGHAYSLCFRNAAIVIRERALAAFWIRGEAQNDNQRRYECEKPCP